MRLIVTGHREEKLTNYDCHWIDAKIHSLVAISMRDYGVSVAYSGMASGVDLYFCKACVANGLPFIACVPFEGQEKCMTLGNIFVREEYLKKAKEVKKVRNSWMVENCDIAIAVWDGNKGGTHNVIQQLVERKKNFFWVNPVSCVVWNCFNGG